MGTICGIDERLFKQKPTPAELGDIIAHWTDKQQAEFFGCLGESLRNCCGSVFVQWQAIADALRTREEELLDESGSDFLKEIVHRLIIDSQEVQS
jgi:hypothetical protein